MWTLHTDAGNRIHGGQYAKNVYLGETRIVTKLRLANDDWTQAEEVQQYFYHSDHLGSASMITDYKGDEYQRIEYTPYGETWVEKTRNQGLEYLPYKFTGKEKDEETGLYYYGARYLDPKYSRWLSTDPALGEYIPAAGKGNARDAGSLPGMGGAYNHINFNLYHYAGNNPVKYTDPDGKNAKYVINDKNKSIDITIDIVIYGSGATQEIAQIYQDGINRTWNGDFSTKIGDENYSVNVNANVTVGEKPNNISKTGSTNYINVDKDNTRSFVKGNGVEGTWRANGRNGSTLENDNPAAHEVGHLLGLDDRYHDVKENGQTYSVANEGWGNNLMGGGKLVEQRNIDGVMKSVNNPSAKKEGIIIASPMEN